MHCLRIHWKSFSMSRGSQGQMPFISSRDGTSRLTLLTSLWKMARRGRDALRSSQSSLEGQRSADNCQASMQHLQSFSAYMGLHQATVAHCSIHCIVSTVRLHGRLVVKLLLLVNQVGLLRESRATFCAIASVRLGRSSPTSAR